MMAARDLTRQNRFYHCFRGHQEVAALKNETNKHDKLMPETVDRSKFTQLNELCKSIK